MGAHFQQNSRRRKAIVSDINITPFVDVLLVLLIIFMVAAPMMVGSVELDLPEGSAKAPADQDNPISVSVKSDGTVYLQDKAIKLRLVTKELKTITNNDTKSKIFVRADSNLDYGRVMKVIKTINSAGFTQVVLVTEISN
jgi:biopolymer transport protein TolR